MSSKAFLIDTSLIPASFKLSIQNKILSVSDASRLLENKSDILFDTSKK
jgi:hypothetical protein